MLVGSASDEAEFGGKRSSHCSSGEGRYGLQSHHPCLLFSWFQVGILGSWDARRLNTSGVVCSVLSVVRQ